MYIGIDIGTSSVKSLLIDSSQGLVGSASVALRVLRPREGWSEQDPLSWWHSVRHTLDQLAASHPQQMCQVKGIGLSGQMHGATLLDASGQALRPAVLWNDVRADAECQELESNCPESRDLTGNIAMPGFTAPKLLWVRKHEPQVFDKISKVLLPKDYIRYCLSGEYISDMSDASGTLWLNMRERTWSPELLAATGLDIGHMPALVEGSDSSATLKTELQQRWGMQQSVVIAGGAGDNAATACGMGTTVPGRAFISIGTSGVIFVSNDAFSPNTDSALHAFCHALPQTWHQMGVVLSASDSLQWLAKIAGQSPTELTGQLGEITAPSSAQFLPYLGGERTPHNDASVRGMLCGLSHNHDAISLTQAVLEGVAYAFKDSQNALLQAGTDFQAAYAVGGGSRSRAWLKIIAAVLDRPLLIPEGTEQGAAFGAARLAMIAAERCDPLEVCTQPKISDTIEVDRSLKEQYQFGYERYQRLYPALKENSI